MTPGNATETLGVIAVFVSLLLTLFTVWIYKYVKRPPKLRSVAIVVVGDVGRSPRMMYHAESFAKLGFSTYLIGYRGEWRSSFCDMQAYRCLARSQNLHQRLPSLLYPMSNSVTCLSRPRSSARFPLSSLRQ